VRTMLAHVRALDPMQEAAATFVVCCAERQKDNDRTTDQS
jgi:hypothetical protein